jgi:hypothetical protein
VKKNLFFLIAMVFANGCAGVNKRDSFVVMPPQVIQPSFRQQAVGLTADTSWLRQMLMTHRDLILVVLCVLLVYLGFRNRRVHA